MGEIKSYKDLIIWRNGLKISELTYKLTKDFPKEEVYGMTSQMKRSSISIPSNIAEGFGRSSTVSYIQYLRIARGSLYELDTQLTLSRNLDLTKDLELITEIENLISDEGKMINSYIKKLKEKV
ncbi:MAG: four helix bundle protein [Bacteroidota bacterium]